MGYFEFPHTRTYDSDLGWLIRHTKMLLDCCENMTEWKTQHEEEYEELVNKVNGLINSLIEVIKPWDPGYVYPPFSIVEYQGQNYIALQEVPIGILITNTEYWTPANTVIEQINAIGVVVDNMQKMWNVVETFDDLAATTTDRVLVLNDDSYYGSGQAVWFEKSPNDIPEVDYLQRTNGDYMQPMVRTDSIDNEVPYGNIGAVIASYVSNRDIIYGNGDTLFSANPNNKMDCSTFVQAVIQGISYEHSRYVQNTNDYSDYIGDNIPRNPASYYDLTRPYGYKVQGLALWFAEQNRLFKIDYTKRLPASQLKTGDIIFEGNGPLYTYDLAETRYLKLHHAAVVLYVYPEANAVLIAQCGNFHHDQHRTQYQGLNYQRNVCRISTLILDPANQEAVQYYARPGYHAGATQAAELIYEIHEQAKEGSPAVINSTHLAAALFNMRTIRPITSNEMYTLVVEGDLPTADDNTAFDLRSLNTGEGTVQMAFASDLKIKNKLVIPFVPFDDLALPQNLTGRALAEPYSAGSIGENEYEYTIKSVSLYKGIITDADAEGIDITSECVRSNDLTFGNLNVTLTERGIRIRASFHLNTAVSSGTHINIISIPPKYMPNPVNIMVVPIFSATTDRYHQATLGSNGNLDLLFSASMGTGNLHCEFTI